MVEKKKEERKVRFKLKGQLKLYIQWPAIMALLLMAMNIWIYEIDRNAGLLMLVFVLIYIAMIAVLYFYSRGRISIWNGKSRCFTRKNGNQNQGSAEIYWNARI